MAGSRELMAAIRQRDGVEAAVIVGRDGLLIDGSASSPVDADHVAAHVPSLLAAAEELGGVLRASDTRTIVVEYDHAVGIISALSADTALLVLTAPSAELGPLLFELRRNRERIAALL